jgi:hypothetical protein
VTIVVTFELGGLCQVHTLHRGVGRLFVAHERRSAVLVVGPERNLIGADATELETSETSRPSATTIALVLSAPSYGPRALSSSG